MDYVVWLGTNHVKLSVENKFSDLDLLKKLELITKLSTNAMHPIGKFWSIKHYKSAEEIIYEYLFVLNSSLI